MSLSARQCRQYKLVLLILSRQELTRDLLLSELACSAATFDRELRAIRQQFNLQLKFDKNTGSYHVINTGSLTEKLLQHMSSALRLDGLQVYPEHKVTVFLDKEVKKSISMSLRSSVVRKIESYAYHHKMNRSQVIEWLVDEYLTQHFPKKNVS